MNLPNFYPGVAYKNGKLYRFDPNGVTVIRMWPNPAAWRKTRFREWRHIRPVINLDQASDAYWESELSDLKFIRDASCESESDAARHLSYQHSILRSQACYQAATRPVPSEIIKIVRRFPHERQFHMLSLLGRCDGALELAQTNPALVFALASNWVFHRPSVRQPMRAARALLRKRRRQICAWLGFPSTESMVRCLERIPPSSTSIGILLSLRNVCRDPKRLRMLGFVSRINADVVAFMANEFASEQCSAALLNQLGARAAGDERPMIFFKMLKVLAEHRDMYRFFRSVDEIEQLHAALPKADPIDIPEIIFPAPPLPGYESIIAPITTYRELTEWGRLNHNCCASYWPRITNRSTYIYKLQTPEGILGTIAVKRVNKKWVQDEFKEADNLPPRPALRTLVNQWLSAQLE